MAKWKVTRGGKDGYKRGNGTSKQEALEAAKLFNGMAARNGNRGKPYGLRPVEEDAK